jgi:RNA polymerase sigma-70 factor (sigma-E family)
MSSVEEQFTAYVGARRTALVRTAYLLTGNAEDAEDLVQTALIKAVPKWGRIAEDPEPYVRAILARESVNRWRRRRWRELPSERLPEGQYVDVDVADRASLRSALAALAPRQRAVIVLRYYEDMTERQTADALGISVGTVKSQCRDALARLRVGPLAEGVPERTH